MRMMSIRSRGVLERVTLVVKGLTLFTPMVTETVCQLESTVEEEKKKKKIYLKTRTTAPTSCYRVRAE